MYHYPYAWEALARTHTYEGADSRSGSLAECLASIGIDLAYPIDTSDLSLSLSLLRSLALAADTLALWLFAILRAVSRAMTLQSHGQQCVLPSPVPFFPSLFAGLESCAKPGIAARSPQRTRERRHNRRECQAIFSSRCSAIRYISLRRRLSAP